MFSKAAFIWFKWYCALHSNIVKYYYNIKEHICVWIYLFLWCKAACLSIIIPVFRSRDDPSRIKCADLLLKKHFLLLSTLNTVVLFNMLETMIHFFFRIFWWIENVKEQHLFEIYIFSNITKVTFDQFNVFFINKSTPFFKKNVHCFWTVVYVS